MSIVAYFHSPRAGQCRTLGRRAKARSVPNPYAADQPQPNAVFGLACTVAPEFDEGHCEPLDGINLFTDGAGNTHAVCEPMAERNMHADREFS